MSDANDNLGVTFHETKGLKDRWAYSQSTISKTIFPGLAASMAIDFMQRWGLVAAIPDGEDSAGRQKLRLQTEAELVERACKSAEIAMKEFRARGWLLDVPAPSVFEDGGDAT